MGWLVNNIMDNNVYWKISQEEGYDLMKLFVEKNKIMPEGIIGNEFYFGSSDRIFSINDVWDSAGFHGFITGAKKEVVRTEYDFERFSDRDLEKFREKSEFDKLMGLEWELTDKLWELVSKRKDSVEDRFRLLECKEKLFLSQYKIGLELYNPIIL